MDSYEALLTAPPYSISQIEKNKLFKKALFENFLHHYNNCLPYQKLCIKRGWNKGHKTEFNLEEFPYLPVEIFKDIKLAPLQHILSEGIFRVQKPQKINVFILQ